MSAPTFAGGERPDLEPIVGEPGFYTDAAGGVYEADPPPTTNGTKPKAGA